MRRTQPWTLEAQAPKIVDTPMLWGNLAVRLLWTGTLVFVWAAFAPAQHSALDLSGRPVNPLAADSGKVTVLVFLRRDCPVSARYAPAIQQISKRYPESADFWLVYPDRSDTAPAIRKSVAEYGYKMPVLRDPEHVLVKLAHVQITPEVAVFDRKHQLVYDGRIDDWYVEFGRSRPAPTTHELEDAIRAAGAGQPVARNEIRGVGCYISDVE